MRGEGVEVAERAERSLGGNPWLIAAILAVVVVAGTLTLFRVPAVQVELKTSASASSSPAVTLARETDGLLTEEAAMRDPTPLFLPTVFNATEEAFTAGTRRELSSAFRGFEPKLKYSETALDLRWPAVVELPQRAADAFETNKPARPFVGFGQAEAKVASLSARKGFVEVVSAGDGELMLAQPLIGASPPAESAWRPLQFLVAVDASGVVGPPVLTESSQVASVDSYFQEYLLNVLHLGERLAPGFYRVGIGP